MASLSAVWLYNADRGLRGSISADSFVNGKPRFNQFFQLEHWKFVRAPSLPCIKCEKKDEDVEHVYVELPPYHSYMDSTSGQLEPASGARASIPEQEYWPEGTADRDLHHMAKSLEAGGKSIKASVAAPESSEASIEFIDSEALESDEEMKEEPKDDSSDYVIYDTEPEEEETGYELDKKLGRPHPFIDPKVKKPIQGILSQEELWWNWRKQENEQWSRWQRRKPDVET
ncbi:hypothetical protein OIU76_019584, partial [Salix suchowensis]